MIQCPSCTSVHLVRSLKAHRYSAPSLLDRLLGRPVHADHSADVVTCSECLTQFLVTGDGAKRLRLGKREVETTAAEHDDHRARATAKADPDIPWSRR